MKLNLYVISTSKYFIHYLRNTKMFYLKRGQRKLLPNSYLYVRLKHGNRHDTPYTISKTKVQNEKQSCNNDFSKIVQMLDVHQKTNLLTNVSRTFFALTYNLARILKHGQVYDLNSVKSRSVNENCIYPASKDIQHIPILPLDKFFSLKPKHTFSKGFESNIFGIENINRTNYSIEQVRSLHTTHSKNARNANLRKTLDIENFNPATSRLANKENLKPIENLNEGHIKSEDQFSSNNIKFQFPKNILHSYFSIISQELGTDLSLSPSYAKHHDDWQCTYHLKWPESVKISKQARSKKDASHKAAVTALEWLKSHGKLDSEGKPIIYDPSTIKKIYKKSNRKVLILEDPVLDKLHSLYERYRNNFFKYLESDVEINTVRHTSTDLTNLENPWPLNQTRQKVLNLDDYVAKEGVTLPIQEFKNDIINAVSENRVVIIKGDTGCGKSIRVPQYVLEAWSRDGALDGKPCKIIVTEPRRIAAMSLAERVAFERDEEVGKVVGYQIRFNAKFDNSTGRILYCTTGILLRRLQTDPSLSDCTHIVLDEAHERDVNTDLLMNLLQYALKRNPQLKLLIMSATINTDVFKEYFEDAVVFNVPGITYPVKQHYIDSSSTINFEKTLNMCKTPQPYVISDDVVNIIKHIHRKKPEGAILCFLPTWEDISRVSKALPPSQDMTVLCLHSKLDIAEQKKVFGKPPPGIRKVILSTNIAETSVTINDVVYVVDTGIQKQTKFDAEKGIMCIDQEWISQANVTQRKGRAGRVQPGESFHLYTKKQMENFDKYPIPEILRTSLTKIVLDSKVCSNNMNALDFLSQLPTAPTENAIIQAVNQLRELELLDEDENLTPLGRTLSNFQMEPKLAKAIVDAIIFRCVTPIIDIVTLFSEETNIFSSVLLDREDIKEVKGEFSKASDHLAMVKIFEKWLEYMENGDRLAADMFCTSKNLIRYKLYTLKKLRDVYFDYIYKGFNREVVISDDFSNNDEMIKAVLLSDAGSILKLSNMEKVKGRLKKSNVLLTRNNHKANISMESVNSKRSIFPSDFLVYINETRSNVRRTTTVRETSFIPLLSLLLFKNEDVLLKEIPMSEYSDQLDAKEQVTLELKNAKIQCICDKSHAEAIMRCREALKAGIIYYTSQLTSISESDPQIDGEWKEILKILSSILSGSKI